MEVPRSLLFFPGAEGSGKKFLQSGERKEVKETFHQKFFFTISEK